MSKTHYLKICLSQKSNKSYAEELNYQRSFFCWSPKYQVNLIYKHSTFEQFHKIYQIIACDQAWDNSVHFNFACEQASLIEVTIVTLLVFKRLYYLSVFTPCSSYIILIHHLLIDYVLSITLFCLYILKCMPLPT